MNKLFSVLLVLCFALAVMGFAPSSSRMTPQKMTMLFNFGKKPSSSPAAPKAAVSAKPAASVKAAAKPAAKPAATKPAAVTTKAAAVKVAATPSKSSTPAYTKPNPTPEAYVDNSNDFFAFSRSLPAWLKKKAT